MNENKETKQEEFENEEKVETVEVFYSQKTMLLAVGAVGLTSFMLGQSKGIRIGYLAGVKDGLATSNLEDYAQVISDLASLVREITE